VPHDIDVEENGADFIENALLKARAYRDLDGWILAEDSGLVIPALDGRYDLSPFPGVRSKRWLTPARRAEILGTPLNEPMSQAHLNAAIQALMKDNPDRHAAYRCGMVLLCDDHIVTSTGELALEVIEDSPRGEHGFGYDPIMTPVSESRTVAELTTDEKNQISHRCKAFKNILAKLNSRI